MKERRKEVILAAVQEDTEKALAAPADAAQWSHAAALAERLLSARVSVQTLQVVSETVALEWATATDLLDALRRLASELIERERCVVLLSAPKDGGDTLLFARSASLDADMSALLRQTVAEIGGKGGGRSDFAQGSSPCENAVQRAAAILRAK